MLWKVMSGPDEPLRVQTTHLGNLLGFAVIATFLNVVANPFFALRSSWHPFLGTFVLLAIGAYCSWLRPASGRDRACFLLTLLLNAPLLMWIRGVPIQDYLFYTGLFTATYTAASFLARVDTSLTLARLPDQPTGNRKVRIAHIMIFTALVAITCGASFKLRMEPFELLVSLVGTSCISLIAVCIAFIFTSSKFRSVAACLVLAIPVFMLTVTSAIKYTEPGLGWSFFGRGGFALSQYWLGDLALVFLFVAFCTALLIWLNSIAAEARSKERLSERSDAAIDAARLRLTVKR